MRGFIRRHLLMVRRFIRRNLLIISSCLIAISAALLVTRLIADDARILLLLQEHESGLGVICTILNTLLFVAAAIVAYLRFWVERPMALRANISLGVSVFDTPNYRMHEVTLRLENTGSRPIINPRPRIQYELHDQDPTRHLDSIEEWRPVISRPIDSSTDSISVVQPSETVSFTTTVSIPRDIDLVTYSGYVECDGGDAWGERRTVSNSPATNDGVAPSH